MLYRIPDSVCVLLASHAWATCPVMPDPEATNDAALGRTTRAYDWNAETWEAAITDAYTHGLPGLADKCTDIAAEMRRQEAGQCC